VDHPRSLYNEKCWFSQPEHNFVISQINYIFQLLSVAIIRPSAGTDKDINNSLNTGRGGGGLGLAKGHIQYISGLIGNRVDLRNGILTV